MGSSRKIDMKRIENVQARRVTFSKRHKGLFRKADHYRRITGSEIAVIVFTTAGRPVLHGSPSTLDRFLASNEPQEAVSWADRVERSLNGGDATLEQLVALRREGEELKLRVQLQLEDQFVGSLLCHSCG